MHFCALIKSKVGRNEQSEYLIILGIFQIVIIMYFLHTMN
jgi:hypothetical protein